MVGYMIKLTLSALLNPNDTSVWLLLLRFVSNKFTRLEKASSLINLWHHSKNNMPAKLSGILNSDR